MTTPLTNADYSTQLVDLIAAYVATTLSEADFITQLTTLVNDWTVGAITPTQVGIQLSNALGNWNNFVSGQLEFFTIPVSGGPHGNGTVDMIDYLGNVTTIPSLALLTATLITGGSPLGAWALKTTNYTMGPGERIGCDSSGAPFTLTLPATPASGAECWVQDVVGSFLVHPVTLARNGSTIRGAAENLILDVAHAGLIMVYLDSTWTF